MWFKFTDYLDIDVGETRTAMVDTRGGTAIA